MSKLHVIEDVSVILKERHSSCLIFSFHFGYSLLHMNYFIICSFRWKFTARAWERMMKKKVCYLLFQLLRRFGAILLEARRESKLLCWQFFVLFSVCFNFKLDSRKSEKKKIPEYDDHLRSSSVEIDIDLPYIWLRCTMIISTKSTCKIINKSFGSRSCGSWSQGGIQVMILALTKQNYNIYERNMIYHRSQTNK